MSLSHEEAVARAKQRISEQLKRSLNIRKVEVVTEDYETSRFNLGEHDALIRVTTAPIEKMEVIETPEVLQAHLDEQLFDVDASIVDTSFPPRHLVNKCPVFYLRASL